MLRFNLFEEMKILQLTSSSKLEKRAVYSHKARLAKKFTRLDGTYEVSGSLANIISPID